MSGGGRVLVIDDDEGTRRVLLDALTDEGYTVRAAANGADALELLAAYDADLILLERPIK